METVKSTVAVLNDTLPNILETFTGLTVPQMEVLVNLNKCVILETCKVYHGCCN